MLNNPILIHMRIVSLVFGLSTMGIFTLYFLHGGECLSLVVKTEFVIFRGLIFESHSGWGGDFSLYLM